MSGPLCLICLSLVVIAVVPHAWCQSHEPDPEESQERPVVPQDFGTGNTAPEDPRVRLKGLCRNGWTPGTMKDFSGKEIPVCLKINPEALTWSEAQDSCRKDYGFLMKLDSRATIDDSDLLTSVILNGITNFWTGMHSENGHLIWDDLIPNQVRPHNRVNDTSLLDRPWTWGSSTPEKRQQYCGQMNVITEGDKRRRKRSSDDDSNDNIFPAFDLSHFQKAMLNNNFRRQSNAFPQTSAFRSMLSRTQMSDQLEIPDSLGLQSERQIPGSGNPDANIQNGGLATDSPSFDPTEQPDYESVSPFGNLNTVDGLNTESNENSVLNPEGLLESVKEVAANIGSNIGALPAPLPTEAVEALRNLIKENAESFKSETTDLAVNENRDSFVPKTTIIPPTTFTPGASNERNIFDTKQSDDTSTSDNTELMGTKTSEFTDTVGAQGTDVSSLLSDGNTDDLKPLKTSSENVDDMSEKVSTGINDFLNAKNKELKEKDVVGHLSHETATVTSADRGFTSNLNLLNNSHTAAPKIVTDEFDKIDDISDEKKSDDSLGFGHLTDLLTSEAVKKAVSLNEINNNNGNEDAISNKNERTPETDIQTPLNLDNQEATISILNNFDGSDLDKKDDILGTNVGGNAHTGSDQIEDTEKNQNENMVNIETLHDLKEDNNHNFEIESLIGGKDNLEQILPESFDLPDKDMDTQKSDETETVLLDDSLKEMQLEQNTEDKSEQFQQIVPVTAEELEKENVNEAKEYEADMSVYNEGMEHFDDYPRSNDESPSLSETLSDVNEKQEIGRNELNEETKDDNSGFDDNIFNDDIKKEYSDDSADLQKERTLDLDRDAVDTQYFDDMAERLREQGKEDLADMDTDSSKVKDDVSETSKHSFEKSRDQDIIDEIKENLAVNSDKDNNAESKYDKNDDGQSKRDSGWPEFDLKDEHDNVDEKSYFDPDNIDASDISEQGEETYTGNEEYDQFDVLDNHSELNENLEKVNDDKSFHRNWFDDLNENKGETFISQNEKDTEPETEISNFEDGFREKEDDTNIELEPDILDPYQANENEDDIKQIEAEIEIPDSVEENKENERQWETDDTEIKVPDFVEENREHERQWETDDTGMEIDIPDSTADENEKEAQLKTEKESEIPDTFFEDQEEHDRFDEIPDLAEDVVESDTKSALAPEVKSKQMLLTSCEVRLPSVCFGYQVEVMDKASTCENGWYGHVLLDTCYRILDKKMTYGDAVSECQARSARVLLAGNEFERTFVLIAVQKDGRLFRGEKFWMESPSDKADCKYFDEKGVQTMPSCDTNLNVVCAKDAKSLSVYTTNSRPNGGDLSFYHEAPPEQRIFVSKKEDNKLPCQLTSVASEFPVLWFKDNVLVETKDKYISSDISLYLNAELVSSIGMVTDRNLATPALQGQYWCEVWDRQTLTRKKSQSFNVRFSDVISFHGSMELPAFSKKDELLFNMANRKFPEMSAAELDIQKVFADVLPMLQAGFPDVINVFTYVDGIRSNPNVIEYHTYFTLNRDYIAQDEDIVYNRLKALLRAKLGNRYYMASLPGQTPLSTFRTMSLHSTVSCPAATLQTTRDLYGRTIPVKIFTFPKAGLGEYANSIENCSITNMLPSGSARCLGDFYTGAYWGDIVANECIEESDIDQFNNEIWGVSPYTDKLTEISKVTVDERNVENLVSEVAQIAKVAQKFTPTDINKIADVLDHTTQVRNLPQKVGEDVLKTVDRLMTISEQEAHVANVETKAANRIIKSLERYAENADIGTRDQVRLVSDNVVVEIWNLKPTIKPVIGLAAETKGTGMEQPFKTESIATVYNKSQLYEANVDAAIELPTEIFSTKEKGARVSDRLTMMVFRKSKLFKAAITDGGRKMNPTEQQLSNLNSYIISASIAGKKLQDLNEKVKTIFKPIKDVESGRSCVWWDFDMNNYKGGWSNKGCVYDGKVNGRDVCLCDHLTNFAVLIDFYGQAKPIPDHHELSLSIITVLGLSCSILGLSLTIISYLFFRKLRQGRAQQTLFNLSLSLLLSMLVFLVGVKQTHNYYGCVVVALLLHYLILVSFMWMLMEAILQYLTFVKILGTYITRFTLKTVLPAWGLPLLPVIAVLCVDYTLYKGGPNYCWMDLPAFYYAFAIPVTCIIIINVIIFVVTVISIFRRGKGLRSNQKKQKMAMTNLQAAITSFILLGLTWIFGYLAISDARLTFQYVFTILNSLQGFFIFILFVVRKKKVREQWYFICCKGIEKDRVSRSLSASNSIPSTYSNGSNRNSRKDGRERERSDSTKTVQSTYSNASNGFTNYGYDHGYDFPFSRYDRRAFRKF